jgi:hypothetical protein
MHGEDAAYQLIEQNGSQIVSNSAPVCYVICTCSIKDEYINDKLIKTCQPSFQTVTSYAYAAASCSD